MIKLNVGVTKVWKHRAEECPGLELRFGEVLQSW